MWGGILTVDSKGTCAASSTAGDAWADANAGLAGGAEQDAASATEISGILDILGLQGYHVLSQHERNRTFINKYNERGQFHYVHMCRVVRIEWRQAEYLSHLKGPLGSQGYVAQQMLIDERKSFCEKVIPRG